MATRGLLIISTCLVICNLAGLGSAAGVLEAPPLAVKQPNQLITNGDVRIDNYYWLRDDERKSPDVLSYLLAENTYTAHAMADTQQLQLQLYEEMKARIQEADETVAVRRDGYFYYTLTQAGQQYSVHCRRAVAQGTGPASELDVPAADAAEEVILDENQRKEEGGYSFYMIGTAATSPNQQLLAWTEDTVGGEKYTLHVKDISTGKELITPIPMTSGDVVWANDNKHLFYTVKDDLDRPCKVLRHEIGSSSPDAVVFDEPDEAYYVDITSSTSGQLIQIGSTSAVTNETLFIDANKPTDPFQVILPRTQNVEYVVSHHPGSSSSSDGSSSSTASSPGGWFLMTYRDASRPNSELRVAPVSDPTQQRVLLPHRSDVAIEAAAVGRSWLVVSERSNALESIVVYQLPQDGSMPTALGEGITMKFDEPAYSLSGGLTGDFDSEVLRLRYSSLTTPSSIYDQHLGTGNRVLKKETPVLGGFNKDDYVTQRLWATAPDGVQVAISLAFRKGMVKLDGSDHMLLHGYGSYSYTYDPSFNRDELSLMDRGWIVAIAHIRGGGEGGRMWYEDGKFLKKKNTFTDFIACAEHLVDERYTSPSKLAIEGRSAGGLLMGAVTNMRPDLFHSVIMGVPFVDALTTMLDESIPLTTTEFEEWGNPQEPEYYYYMKSYSPVDNVKAQDYPHILVSAGLHDPRVGYWEPAKLVAKMRDVKTDANLLLLKTDMGAGHFSVTGRFERLKEKAFEFAFLLKTAAMLDA